MTVELTEEDRQLVLLALALMSLQRPGFTFACQEAANQFGGVAAQEMFKEFRRLNADQGERAQEQQRQFHLDALDSPTLGDLQSPPASKLRLHLAEEK